jgi:hypothetical protein
LSQVSPQALHIIPDALSPVACSVLGALQLRGRAQTALGVAVGGLFIAILSSGLAGFAALFWLLLWSAAEAGRALWAEVKRRLDAGQPLPLPPGVRQMCTVERLV